MRRAAASRRHPRDRTPAFCSCACSRMAPRQEKVRAARRMAHSRRDFWRVGTAQGCHACSKRKRQYRAYRVRFTRAQLGDLETCKKRVSSWHHRTSKALAAPASSGSDAGGVSEAPGAAGGSAGVGPRAGGGAEASSYLPRQRAAMGFFQRARLQSPGSVEGVGVIFAFSVSEGIDRA